MTARLLLVDAHTATREALAAVLDRLYDMTVVGQASSLAQARPRLSDVDLVLTDFALPDGLATELIEPLRQANPHAVAIVLADHLGRAQFARAVCGGAAGVLEKTARLGAVVRGIRLVLSGHPLVSAAERAEMSAFDSMRRTAERSARDAIAALTARELEIMRLVAEGLDSRAISERLFISERTVRNHVANVLAKLAVHSRLEALVFCLRHGVVDVMPSSSALPTAQQRPA